MGDVSGEKESHAASTRFGEMRLSEVKDVGLHPFSETFAGMSSSSWKSMRQFVKRLGGG